MAKCIHCEYPYATGRRCPNCGSKNPKGLGCLGIIIFLVVGFVIYQNVQSSDSKLNYSSTDVSPSSDLMLESSDTLSGTSTVAKTPLNGDYNDSSNFTREEINNDDSNNRNLPVNLENMIKDGGVYISDPKKGVLYQGLYYYVDGRVYDPENDRYGRWTTE
ncbi:hypothetical protein [Chryseobacterium sp.]|uniref:hypothetical protein n=1 Tax=Chryseobacterium sp. TaxID=1871047 RepID=UPI0035C74950